jgi:hypothetical protein
VAPPFQVQELACSQAEAATFKASSTSLTGLVLNCQSTQARAVAPESELSSAFLLDEPDCFDHGSSSERATVLLRRCVLGQAMLLWD